MAVIVRWARLIALALVVLVSCDRGIEANQDNLTHFASVASELRRDARELELLAKKVGSVKAKLERRKSEVAEHVFSDELSKQRDALLERLQAGQPTPAPVEGEAEPAASETPAPGDALVGVVALHDQLFTPLDIADDTLQRDNDYWWWLEELGLVSADSGSFGDDPEPSSSGELDRAVDNCRTHFDAQSRADACSGLLANHLTTSHFALIKRQRLSELDSQIERLELIQDEFEAEAIDRRASAEKVMAAYGSSFDGLIIWGFPALVVAVLVIVIFEGRRRRSGGDAAPTDTLAVVTVLLLVSAIIILGLGGKIQPEALGTLIGGISGYVLGKSAQALIAEKPKPSETSATSPAPVTHTGTERTKPEGERQTVEIVPGAAEPTPVVDDRSSQAKA